MKYFKTTIYDSPGLSLNKDKKNVESINVYGKELNKDYVYTFGDIKIKGEGRLTFYLPNNLKITSKKGNLEGFNYELNKNDLILAKGGFIYGSQGKIISNKELEIRNSIIK